MLIERVVIDDEQEPNVKPSQTAQEPRPACPPRSGAAEQVREIHEQAKREGRATGDYIDPETDPMLGSAKI